MYGSLYHAIKLGEDVAAARHVAGGADVEVPALLEFTGVRLAEERLRSRFIEVDCCRRRRGVVVQRADLRHQ